MNDELDDVDEAIIARAAAVADVTTLEIREALRRCAEAARGAAKAVQEYFDRLDDAEQRPQHSRGYVINSWDRRRR